MDGDIGGELQLRSASGNPLDISEFQTPNKSLRNPRLHTPYSQFYTSAKRTPSTNSSVHPKINARMRTLETEQLGFSRQQQIRKQNSLKSLSRYMISWLNFLFSKPDFCGCNVSDFGDGIKRGDIFGNGVEIYGDRRNPKRQRDCFWKSVDDSENIDFSNSLFSSLQSSLHKICSLDDLKWRMRGFLSLDSCKKIFSVMTQVTKNIDEGRLKMKKHCPIITDIGMKEKATRVLMCYSPFWLRIGLYMILGGDSLMPNSQISYDKEIAFLKMVIERLLYSLHVGLAKTHSYNMSVDGVNRPEYLERLGDVMLKRFLLLVLLLDEAKSQSSLSINLGIDGVDGGSPLLFNPYSVVKSSRQMLNDLLPMDVMHGEGNLIAHLMTIGYTVSFKQHPLGEFDFQILHLFEDLKDGVRLSRAINLLENNPSILSKLVLPADSPKRNLTNCGIVLQHLKQAGVPCCDEDGTTIHSDDITSGDKELVLSLIWNMFTHLQLPLLIDKKFLHEETSRIIGEDKELNLRSFHTSSCLEMIFLWIQAICENYSVQIESVSSLPGGKALWCLLDFYSDKELDFSYEPTDNGDVVDDLILSQKLMKMLGSFSEIISANDLLNLKETCNGKSVVILLAFLSSALIFKTNKYSYDQHSFTKPPSTSKNETMSHGDKSGNHLQDALQNFETVESKGHHVEARDGSDDEVQPIVFSAEECSPMHKCYLDVEGDAAKLIQAHYRKWAALREFGKMKDKVSMLQTVIRVWLIMKPKSIIHIETLEQIFREESKKFKPFWRYAMLVVDRHRFVMLRSSAVFIQRCVREWIMKKKQSGDVLVCEMRASATVATTGLQVHHSFTLRCEEVVTSFPEKLPEDPTLCIRESYSCEHDYSATEIQRHCRGWLLQKKYLNTKHACFIIQNRCRCFIAQTYFRKLKIAIVIIQSHVCRCIAYGRVFNILRKVVVLQKFCRRWLARKDFILKRKAATIIQCTFRGTKCHKVFSIFRFSATQIQCFVRGNISRRNLLGASHIGLKRLCGGVVEEDEERFQSSELRLFLSSVSKIQRWWKGVLLKLRTRSAILLQSHFRAFLAKRKSIRLKHFIIKIQSRWRANLARKELKLEAEVTSHANEYDKHAIDRYIAALLELSGLKSARGIIHTCAYLEKGTERSKKVCEELAGAGAVGILAKLIRSASQSVPDQQVLKLTLSTLANISRHPALIPFFILSRPLVRTLLWELLRNKGEGYFEAAGVLKRMCSSKEGVEAVKSEAGLLKRLVESHSLAHKGSLALDRRCGGGRKESSEIRVKEVVDILTMLKLA